jgi:CNT family concentrative nucleoside transporter
MNAIIQTSGFSLESLFRGALGIFSLLIIAFLFSRDRKGIDWKLVVKGLGIQLLFAIFILKVPFVYSIFSFIAKGFTKIIDFTNKGSEFLFGNLMDYSESWGYIFAVQVLPTVIFFSALTSLFYYWRILPRIVYGFAWVMKKTLKLSGPESVAAAGNIFLGQTEAPLLVKPYLDKMTKSEMLCLMSGGMATIAGGVLAAFIGMLGEEFAIHLIMASVMSAPAAVVSAKMLLPEEEKFDSTLEVNVEGGISNELEAISQGTTDGLKLAVNVGAMLLVFTALMYMANYILFKIGLWTDINGWIAENTRYSELSFNMILGYIGAPIAWLMGVCKEDMFLVGQLLGEKTVLNEFVGYMSLGEMKNAGLFAEQKSIIIATYILCGFANFASIGIQIGGIGSLAPKRRGDLSRLGILALIGGTLASLFTAVIVGMLI